MAYKSDGSNLVPVPSNAVIPERDINSMPALECKNLGITFGGLHAVENFNLITKMTALIKEKTKRAICSQLGLGDDKADIALEFVISGMISSYQMWFRSDRSRPLSDVSDIVGALSFHGLYGLLNS